MKVKSSIRSLARKDGSYVVRRRGHLYVINKKNPHWEAQAAQLIAVHMPDGEAVHVPHSLVKAVRKGYVKPR